MSSDEPIEATATVVPAEPASTPAPTPPARLSEDARAAVEADARELASNVLSNPSDRELGRRVSAIGTDAQRRSGVATDLLKTRVGTLLADLDGEGARIPKGLIELRQTMDKINPTSVARDSQGWFSRLLRRTPVVGDAIANIAVRYETVQTSIDAIIGGLLAGRDELLQDSIELDNLYKEVQNSQVEVQGAAYLGELIWNDLEGRLESSTDSTEQSTLRTIVHRVAMRVQDLRTMEQVNTQFFASIDLTIQNNDHLSDAVTRTVTVTRSLLTVGLAIQAALAKQRGVLEAVQQTQAYASEMLAQNAASIRQQTQAVGDLYTNPVLALDKVTAAYHDLASSLDELDEIRRTGTKAAREGVAQMTTLTADMAKRADALHESRAFPGDEIDAGGEAQGAIEAGEGDTK